MSIEKIYQKLLDQKELSEAEMKTFFDQIMQGQVDDILLSSMLTALKIKGESAQEIAWAASACLVHAKDFPQVKKDFIDLVGTGGDHSNTFNISTATCLVLASMGQGMIKHGNKSVSSKSGSSDILSALGININLEPETSKKLYDKVNICFLHAPIYHVGFKNVINVRGALKTRTIFNLLGPLLNPARPQKTMIGVFKPELVDVFSHVLKEQAYEKAIVVHGSGTDEVAIHGPTKVSVLDQGKIKQMTLHPSDFGLKVYDLDSLKGGRPEENATLVRNILGGKGTEAQHAVIAINAALALSLNSHDDLKAHAQNVLEHLRSGKSLELLERYAKESQYA